VLPRRGKGLDIGKSYLRDGRTRCCTGKEGKGKERGWISTTQAPRTINRPRPDRGEASSASSIRSREEVEEEKRFFTPGRGVRARGVEKNHLTHLYYTGTTVTGGGKGKENTEEYKMIRGRGEARKWEK